MGRRHLSRAAALAALAVAFVFALVASVPASAGLGWRLVADGPAAGSSGSKTTAYVALSRSAAASFTSRLPDRGMTRLAGVDFRQRALIAVFGEFGCRDSLIDVASILQHGRTFDVRLVEHAPKPGTATCMAIFETYRLLTVPKSALRPPYPTGAAVVLARA